MSTSSMEAGRIFSLPDILANQSKRESGTVTIPTFGSIVQKG
jgi:hypothetical protein